MRSATDKLRAFREMVNKVKGRVDQVADLDGKVTRKINGIFSERMDDDLDVRGAFDGLYRVLSELEPMELKPTEASGIMKSLREIDGVLRVIF